MKERCISVYFCISYIKGIIAYSSEQIAWRATGDHFLKNCETPEAQKAFAPYQILIELTSLHNPP